MRAQHDVGEKEDCVRTRHDEARWVADAHMMCPCARGSDMGWLTMTRCPDASIAAGRWLTSSLSPDAPNTADPLLRTAMDQ